MSLNLLEARMLDGLHLHETTLIPGRFILFCFVLLLVMTVFGGRKHSCIVA